MAADAYAWKIVIFIRILSFSHTPSSEITARKSTELRSMFQSEPHLKTVVQNLGVNTYTVGPKTTYFRVGFRTTSRLKKEYLRNKTSYR